ncbi:MAG: hypothetical protein IKU65_02385 [Oscillospiraceae bacterium]|nr:hypothetical protein [Oscillospiraceae bacterium]
MKFFHVYNDECFEGWEKNGMINRDTGFKLQNVFCVPKERQFNNIAKIGGEFHSLIKEGKFPMYVDRIAGGVVYYKYDYDKKLIREYENILGDEFLGFQLHESASNRRGGDWVWLRQRIGSDGPYDVELIKERFFAKNRTAVDGQPLYGFTQGSPEEYAALRYAETPAEFVEEMRGAFRNYLKRTDGHILMVDSTYLMPRVELELGMKTFMPEIGNQGRCFINLMLAFTRGMAENAGKKWGAYYECWDATRLENGKWACTMPCFNDDPINEWYLSQEQHGDDFTTHGPNGGSSRLVQNRIYYYALMSGAHYFSEEWGLNCSYSDMKEYVLSPYGEVKKDFINTAVNLRGIKAVTPFAIVLPKDYETLEISTEAERGLPIKCTHKYLDGKITDDEYRRFSHVEDVFYTTLVHEEYNLGNESNAIMNSPHGNVFDIIYEDAPREVLEKYAYLIDADIDGSFAKKNADSGLKILESDDLEKLDAELKIRIPEVMPVYVSGLCWLVSTDEGGKQYLSIFNNDGNTRTREKGDVVDSAADRVVDVKFKKPTDIKIVKQGNFTSEIARVDETAYKIKVPATGFIIMEI